MQAFSPEILLKAAPTQVFSWEYCEFLRIIVLKNICERMFERLAPWANKKTSNISEEEIFYQLGEKDFPLHDTLDHFVFLYFSTACFKRCLPYIIKEDSSEGH